jgi:nucleoside-diphosphate-sugar epimerase
MRFLIVGASGFVGQVLCKELATQGRIFRAAVRSGKYSHQDAEVAKIGSIDGKTDWSAALRDIDVVIHLAGRAHVMRENSDDPISEYRKVNLHGTANLAEQAALAGVKRLVYASSIKVNGERTGFESKFTETDPVNPQDPYGISKNEAELALRQIASRTNLEIVIVRPPLIYGSGVKGNFVQMLKVLAKGIPLPLASVCNRRSMVYVENLVDALIACATHPAAAGQTYLVSDGEDISTPDLLHRLGEAMGYPARLFPCPTPLLKLAGRMTGKSNQVDRLLGSLQVDSGKIRRELNWTPPFTLQQGLQATAEWYRNTNL